ncbi:hypothetical protein [Tsuneonella amylolytica]|uniref:hypothetical protein n=1 Tax=Tsuneonella amylolytica TaxID=2338327 RepID=UPI000EAA23A4|nr:hypothetical protein [Tsuneonella amylolytica]
MRVLFTASALALALAACSADPAPADTERQEVTDLNSADTDGKAGAMAKALTAGDMTEFTLGAHVAGEDKAEGTTRPMKNEAGNFADLRSYVACPKGMTTCDPKTAPAGTVYTYVLVVYPGGDNRGDRGVAAGNTVSDIERGTSFRTVHPVHGFTGNAGYAKPEALAAIGPKADVVITCDAGKLVWTVSAGDGGDQWEQKEPLTFYWQSTLPPAGAMNYYAFDADGTEAIGSGPYPAAKDGVRNACLS